MMGNRYRYINKIGIILNYLLSFAVIGGEVGVIIGIILKHILLFVVIPEKCEVWIGIILVAYRIFIVMKAKSYFLLRIVPRYV